MKIQLRLFVWMMAVLSVTGWVSGAEPATSFVSYKNLESSLHEQSAELQELRARLASLEREVVYADSGSSYGHYDSWGQSSCQSCCTPHSCSEGWTFYGGAEVVWLKPHFRGATAFSTFGLNADATEVVPLDYDFDVSGRYSLGGRGANGTGMRVRYWQWEHLAATDSIVTGPNDLAVTSVSLPGTDITEVVFAAFGDTLDVFHRLEMNTLDLEVTQDFQLGSSALRIAGGIRYLRLDQTFGANDDNAIVPESLRYRQSFEGIGPTVAMELTRAIGFNLSFYAQARGSVTFGERDEYLVYDFVGGGSAYTRSGADEMISVGELGIGLQADLGALFIRGGYEGQIWWNAGSPNEGIGDMGLHGFNVSAGLNF